MKISQDGNFQLVTPPQEDSILEIQHPSDSSPIWDGQPLAAIFIKEPEVPTTRNFVSGIWIITNGGAIDKGRGLGIQNLGASDGMVIIQEGVNGTGAAIVMQTGATNAFGMVISPTLQTHTGLIIRQELSISPTAGGNLLTLEANGQVNEMMRVNSTLANQVGIMCRMTGSASFPIVVQDAGLNIVASLDNTGVWLGELFLLPGGGYLGTTGSDNPILTTPTGKFMVIDYGTAILFRNRDFANRTDWTINNDGHFLGGTDNTFDIGQPGTLRPRLIYAATGMVAPFYQATALTVTALPSAAVYPGAMAYVTDASATTVGTNVTGGGANKVLVWSNGANWRIYAN